MSQHGCPERLSNRSKGFQEDGPSQQTMEVLVETLTGTAFEMTVSPSDTIFAIKSKIFRVEGIPVSQQHLVYNLKELDDASSLRELAIADGARLRLVLGMRGGPISTRRLPPPPQAEPWRDIESFLDSNREDGDWGNGGGGSGWKVTVLVFRDGDRVNMVRVRENHDGTFSPLALALDNNKYSSSLTQLSSPECGGSSSGSPGSPGGSLHDNKVTMTKMLDLRRRMENLSVHKRRPDNINDKADIQKTRSEETLSVPSLLDEPVDMFKHRTYTPYAEQESFAPLYDGNYTRYEYDCSFADRYTLLPPIGTRSDSDQSVQDAVAESERLKVSEGVAGLVEPGVGVGVGVGGGALDDAGEPRRPPRARAPLPAADYGPLVCGSGPPSPPRVAPLAAAGARPQTGDASVAEHSPAAGASDAGDAAASGSPQGEAKESVVVRSRPRCGVCRKRLSVSTEHRCRCGASYCAPHRYKEVHGCHYDYKAPAAPALPHQPHHPQHPHHPHRYLPLVRAPKLPKI